MELYLAEKKYPEPILYVSCGIYVLYLAPFLFTFTLVGIVNCLRDFPCKPICYDFYEEAEEEAEEVDFILVHSLLYSILFNKPFYKSNTGLMILILDSPANFPVMFFLSTQKRLQEALVITNIVQTPRQALEMNTEDNISIAGLSVRYSDIDSELTPSESEVENGVLFLVQ